jgi:uncharacterized protein
MKRQKLIDNVRREREMKVALRGSACFALAFCVFIVLAAVCHAVDAGASPHSKVQSVGLDEVHWTHGFWADRFELCRTQMVPSMERLMEGTNYSQFFQNFRIAAGLVKGNPRGAPFNDGDFYKWLEGACAVLAVKKDVELDKRIDEIITVVAKAQREDGYIHTPVLIRARNGDANAVPFSDRNNFEMYNMGHLLTTACVHHRVTGKTNLLAVARKAAGFLYQTLYGASPEVARSSVCPSHYMGMIDLSRETHEQRYLELAKKFFELRSQIKDGSDDNQDRIPFEQQTNAMGHAVRANYLYAGAADLFMESGDESLWKPLEPIWKNVTEQKMYITGGCGALYDGASPDGSKDQKNITRVHQAYGRNYQLPNTTAHNETCANIGNVLWNWRMFLVTGEARFMDVVELALYNSVLSGVSLDGTNFFYVNPLRTTATLPTDLRWKHQRVPFVSSFCCPPNLVRTIAESAGYAYAKSADALWVNLYGGSTLTTELSGGNKVTLTQETEYPWNGRVRITVNECGGKKFALKFRIPGWSKGGTVRLNLKPSQATTGSASYFEIKRMWHSGDIVDLNFPMPTKLVEANPLVEETLNQVAVKRGPMVYCLESPDISPETRLVDLSILANIDLRAHFDNRLLGGVVVLEGVASVRAARDWKGELYREVQSSVPLQAKIKMIPYFVWANRGASEMSVWIPLTQK